MVERPPPYTRMAGGVEPQQGAPCWAGGRPVVEGGDLPWVREGWAGDGPAGVGRPHWLAQFIRAGGPYRGLLWCTFRTPLESRLIYMLVPPFV